MKLLNRLVAAIIFCFIFACGFGGEVVKVTEVKDGMYNEFQAEELAKLDEIKKTLENSPLDASLSTVLEKTPTYSISEYLSHYPEVSVDKGQDYKVGGYDVLSIMVYEEKELSREAVRVSADGYISLPLIGQIKVENLFPAEIEKLITRKLLEGEYLLDAHVSVMVTEYKSKRFLALGAFQNPGSYSLQAQERLLDAVSKAGGIRWTSDYNAQQAGNKVVVIRIQNPGTPQEHKVVIDIDLQGLLEGREQSSNIFLADKDTVYIPSAEYFNIIGEVKNPGTYPIKDRDITLVEAISIAKGFTPIAARNRTRIIRVEDGVEKIIEIKVDAITGAGKKIQDVVIKANDIIVVPKSFF